MRERLRRADPALARDQLPSESEPRHRPNGLVILPNQDAYVTWRLAAVLIQG